MFRTDKEYWSQLSDQWWQKRRSNAKGKWIFTYHFKNKSSKKCKVVEYQSQISKQLLAYMVIEKDLRDIVKVLIKTRSFLESEGAPENKILIKYLMRSIYISYGRLFCSADGRKTVLKKTVVDNKYMIIHEHLMNIRHEYVAHAGNSPYEVYRLIYLLPPEKLLKKGYPIRGETHFEIMQVISEGSTQEYEYHFLDLQSKILEKIDLLQKKLSEETQNIDIESLYELPSDNFGTIFLK